MPIDTLTQRIEQLERQLKEHVHNGGDSAEVSFVNIIDKIQTVTVAANLTAILAGKPRRISDQILIDTTTATKKLYIYDTAGDVWRSVTIA